MQHDRGRVGQAAAHEVGADIPEGGQGEGGKGLGNVEPGGGRMVRVRVPACVRGGWARWASGGKN